MAACARAATVSIFLLLTKVTLATPATTPVQRLTENDCSVHTLPIEVLQQLMNSAEVILKNFGSGTAVQPVAVSSDAALDGSAAHILLRRMDSELTELRRKVLSLEAGNSPTTSYQQEINSSVVNQVQQLQEETRQVKDQLSDQVQQLQEETRQVKDQLSDQVQQLQEETRQVKDQMSDQVQQLQEEVKNQLSDPVQQLQEETRQVKDQLSAQVQQLQEEVKNQLSDPVQQLQEETRQVKDQLSAQVQQLQEEVKNQLSHQVQQLQEETRQVKDQLSAQMEQLQEEVKNQLLGLSQQVNQTLQVPVATSRRGLKTQSDLDTSIRPQDCYDLLRSGINESGIYTIYPLPCGIPGEGVSVWCDMGEKDVNEGGWTVVLLRQPLSTQVNFNRGWRDYRIGFGSPDTEYWIGNEVLHALTNRVTQVLRVDMTDWDGESRYQEHSSFHVADEDHEYSLRLGKGSGTAGDDLKHHDKMLFSTPDRENDIHDSTHCAAYYKSGFWFHKCHHVTPTGPFMSKQKNVMGMTWYSFHPDRTTLQSLTFKVKPAMCYRG